MQSLRILSLAVFMAFTGLATSCSPFEDGPTISFRTCKARVENTWKVEQALTDDGRDITSEYSSYRFTFNDDATFVISYSTEESYTGTWYVDEDKLYLTYVEMYNGIQRTTPVTVDVKRLKETEMTILYQNYPTQSSEVPVRLMLVGL